jgi:hypothetical protein
MSFRFGALIGFATGYYLGTKAGRERYEQLHRLVERFEPGERVQALFELATERLHESRARPLDVVLPPSPN